MTAAQIAACIQRLAEGCHLVAYWDPNGKVWTIGYGHTAGVVEGQTCTVEQAEAWLEEDNAALVAMVAGLPLFQAAALLDFGFNCGSGALHRVLTGDITVTEDGFLTSDGSLYGRVSGGVVLGGLDARRKLEAALYLAGATT